MCGQRQKKVMKTKSKCFGKRKKNKNGFLRKKKESTLKKYKNTQRIKL